ncbi:heavy-metal-associated domain-containing protein [Paenibacillus sp. HN-1]|uniref:heavy-metal-associated domain-containing protein n=1 Tax=Paenibacillus TaxID=44249 RepID=UPI001CA97EDA|nr:MULTISPECIES: heavy metal-associated domain-containing protein [Paenibacillus]MBY9079268.1 heavy-metal-associated domain-containing protein [Paenibacillus sp. CGMCC 1.18879]MBY9086991.1 heavy-metal-associated domain-containing protein [Paenibacillus sinensis]
MAEATLHVHGMTCKMCSKTIEAELRKLNGVQRISVSYAREKAIIEYEDEALELSEVVRAIETLGFSVSPK